ncbi:transposase IS4 [Thioploca ingrica]|uniref:Transposase IS4 n=1 Tax=Thioploca ingrica TaxID=40754 RepID=A0A090AER5_9GAMM|nr:transposase IS4 [Thioploca ingrica]
MRKSKKLERLELEYSIEVKGVGMRVNIIEHFASLKDPRIQRKKLHALMDIIVLVICGVISGAESWEAIDKFGHEKLDWLRQFIPLSNGIPSHDCIAYVISRLSVKGFQECFRSCGVISSIPLWPMPNVLLKRCVNIGV